MGLNRPVSRILLYPAIHLRSRDACVSTPGSSRRSRAYHVRRPGQIWLARTGSLPGRSLAGYRRWALTPPFHPSPVPCSDPPMGASHTGHRLVCSLLHLTWRRACAAPPLGFLARAAFPNPVSPRVLASPDFALRPGRNPGTQRRVGRPRPSLNYTLLRQLLCFRAACPGAAASEEDDPGRGQAQFDPVCAVPVLLPARVVPDGGVEPDAGAFGLDHPLVR